MNIPKIIRTGALAAVALAAAVLLAPVAANAQGVLFVVNNNVGIGTNSPGAPLEIAPASGNAAFRLNFSGQETWTISNTGSIVTFSMIGSGGQETTFRERLDGDGGKPTFDVQGSVKGTKFINSSSRELKTNFQPLEYRSVIAKLADMDVTSWSYKSDNMARRHYGPVAEDFQAAFGLGDGKTISTIDSAGVAFAAIKGLHELVVQRDAEIDELRGEIAALRQLIEGKLGETVEDDQVEAR